MAILKGYEHLLSKKEGRLHKVHPNTIDGILTAKFVQQEAALRLPSTDFNVHFPMCLLPEVHEQISALFPDERKEEQKTIDNPSFGEKSKMLVLYSARGRQPPMQELMDILPEPSELARKLYTGGWLSPNVANNMARPVTAASVKLEVRLPHINEQGMSEEVRPFWLASDPTTMIHNAFDNHDYRGDNFPTSQIEPEIYRVLKEFGSVKYFSDRSNHLFSLDFKRPSATREELEEYLKVNNWQEYQGETPQTIYEVREQVEPNEWQREFWEQFPRHPENLDAWKGYKQCTVADKSVQADPEKRASYWQTSRSAAIMKAAELMQAETVTPDAHHLFRLGAASFHFCYS
eukprot:s627_g21.t1